MSLRKNCFSSIVLCCYFIFLFHLLKSGGFSKYINPKLAYLSIFTLIILGLMLIYSLQRLMRSIKAQEEHHGNPDHEDHASCECGHHHQSKIPVSNYLLFLPVVIATFFTPQSLSYQMNDSAKLPETPNISKTLPVKVIPQKMQSNAVEYDPLEIGNILFDTLKEPKEKLVNSQVYLLGRVLKSTSLQKDEVILYRMVISCCAADSIPLGIVVKLPREIDLQENSWIGVEGKIQLLPLEERIKKLGPVANLVPPEKVYPFLAATQVYEENPPEDEYLYP